MTILDQAVQAHQNGRLSEAENLYRQVISKDPKNFDALHMLGIVCSGNGKTLDADKFFRAARSIDPGFPPCHVNYGFYLLKQKRTGEAIESFDKALALFPNFAEAWLGRGNALREGKRYDDALDAYTKAIGLKPHLAEAHAGCANMLAELNRCDDAIAAYDKALALKPDLEFVQSEHLHCKMRLCNWAGFAAEHQYLVASIKDKKAQSQPFYFLNISSSTQDQLECAKSWVAKKFPASDTPIWKGDVYRHDRIRIAYISADYREHAVAYLIAGLIESHTKDKFDVIGISLQPEDPSQTGQRMKRAFGQFIDVSRMTDKEIAERLRELEVDIAIDMMAFTQNARTGIFALRPAPVQVKYMFPGTMGASYIDYIIADQVVIPDHQQEFYTEKIAYLPNSFQANDRKRSISEKTFSRDELGLPREGFVFCCFNNSYKINPDTFDIWMRILHRVDDSVLWLVSPDGAVEKNLRKEAGARGVDPGRLVFASRIPYPEHLARLSVANLFLDTTPYNAGATASDALWAGVPVLTRIGDVFAGRVAASLLKAIELPDLVTTTPQAYEEFAIELATNPQKFAALKTRLSQNRLTTPLFDTQRFTRDIEAAYTAMYERHRADLPPEHIYVLR